MVALYLLPQPKLLTLTGGTLRLPERGYILLEPHPATADLFPAERLAQQLEFMGAGQWQVTRDTGSVTPAAEIRCHFDASTTHEQAYRLTISRSGIDAYAGTAAGTFYALQTLAQISRSSLLAAGKAPRLPCLHIEDAPDLERRGVYHDTARGKVPKLATLLQLVDDLASLKINEFQLYVENAFEFRRHPEMYDDTTPLTAEELLVLDEHCRQRHIDFVPSLTSLGHFEKILCRPAFRKLAEAEPADLRRQGIETWSDQPWSLCVTDPAAQQLLADMYHEFLPNFSSDTFNICCDESWDLGKGRSKPLAEQIGAGTLYVNWINRCAALARAHGKRIQMWGDIIRHHPELIAQLPEDVTLHEWGYEANHDFDGRCKTFAESGKRFYVAPGTSSWLTLASRTKNAFGNIHAAAAAGLKYGAAGLLNTDWGDNGHQQMLSVSLLAFAYGAAASWNLGSVENPTAGKPGAKTVTFLKAASLQLFHDPALTFASLAYDLGLTFERFGWQRFNASLEWYLIREKWDHANYVNRAEDKGMAAVEAAMKRLLPLFTRAPLQHPDAAPIRAEMAFTCREILHGIRRNRLRRQWVAAAPKQRNPEREDLRDLPPVLIKLKPYQAEMKRLAQDARRLAADFRQLWLARNKPSRLQDMLDEFARLQREYKQFARG